MAVTDQPTHDELVSSMTGGMVAAPKGFEPTPRLRPDGRPNAEFRKELRRIADARNAWTSLYILATPIIVSLIVARIDTWWAVVAAFPVMAIAQTRFYILHHEAAHRLLFSNRRLNDIIGINILGWIPFGTGTHAYRRGHSNHHRDEFGPNEPDFLLYSFYPITRHSFRRKMRRDATGVSAYRMLKPLLIGWFTRRRFEPSARFFSGQLLVFAWFFAIGQPLHYLWLWALPYFTWYQVQNRLRSIAEHGGMTRSSDRRDTTHHVEQSLLARSLFVPYNVGYHLAHHVDSGVPFRNLPKLHAELAAAGYFEGASMWPNYRSLWASLRRG